MEISGDQLKGRAAERPAASPRIEPRLSLGEQLVLMTAGVEHHRIPAVVGLCGDAYGRPRGYGDAAQSLERAGLVTRTGLLRHLTATTAARVNDRWKRLAHVLRDPAVPADEDADLLLGLAASEALMLNRDDHLRARHHIAACGRGRQPTRFAQLVCEERGVGSMDALVEKLLPPERHFTPADFDPWQNAGIAWLAIYGCP